PRRPILRRALGRKANSPGPGNPLALGRYNQRRRGRECLSTSLRGAHVPTNGCDNMIEPLRGWVPVVGAAALVGCLVGGESAFGAAAPSKLGPITYAVKAVKDVTYYDGPGYDKVKHKLDLFLPEGAKGSPVAVFIHGGAWVQGDKSFLGFYSALARSLARQGVGVAVVNYRLSPKVMHPEHVKDVARAFAWTAKNVAKYGGGPQRVFWCGPPAGGHPAGRLVSAARDSMAARPGAADEPA